MKDSTKILIASIIIFACSIGFFIGAFAFNGSSSCASKAVTCSSKHGFCDFKAGDCCKKKMDCCKRHGGEFRGDKFHHGPHMKPFMDGKQFKEGKPFKDGKEPKPFEKKFNAIKDIAFMDSVLQVSHEQKAALEKQRRSVDSTFKVLRKQKKEAEKALRDALDNNDEAKIAAAKKDILKAQEALLNLRVDGVKGLNKILTKEQQEKFKFMQFERMKKLQDKMPPPPPRG
jgi:Spy/CpxP family protein refolding chaperone